LKLITLIPFQNEEHSLPITINSVKDFSDEIICIYDNSNEETVNSAKINGAKVFEFFPDKLHNLAEVEIRRRLLELGREHDGTHFLFIDADEAVSLNFKNNLDFVFSLNKGERLEMHWVALWKSYYRYKNDKSVWSNNYKDFIFRDDKKADFPNRVPHTPRTPTEGWKSIRLNKDKGNILHFQFANWEAFQLKQSFYRCRDLIFYNGDRVQEINDRYSITLDPNKFSSKILSNIFEAKSTSKVKKNWMDLNSLPENSVFFEQSAWRLDQINVWFEQYGVDFFKDLEIWHVNKIKELAINFKTY
jgi:hypothetical protein